MRYTVEKTKYGWDGWGYFQCSVCGKDVFIRYDAYEKPSTGKIVIYKDKLYCLCWRCVGKCMDVGKKELLKGAKYYEPTKEGEYENG